MRTGVHAGQECALRKPPCCPYLILDTNPPLGRGREVCFCSMHVLENSKLALLKLPYSGISATLLKFDRARTTLRLHIVFAYGRWRRQGQHSLFVVSAKLHLCLGELS